MGIITYNLQFIKKELQHLNSSQLTDLCLRLTKYKKENKELLSFLLFEAHNESGYIDGVKEEMDDLFLQMNSHYFYQAKGMRKVLRLVTKHAKFMASKPAEIELLLHFCKLYISKVEKKISYKPLKLLLHRQLEKTAKLISGLHEDLQYDYKNELESTASQADAQYAWINKQDYL
ncbi:hypothetical protein [Mucilaginibacter aquatilis]|uniref:hypothetical protein n=1 Tax=Mucilaginibacter aquatilis TaxID=1517760 RepID=UPI0012FA0EBF|nr:hypothetical protein [Mucilaginibacter aquatilis]